MGTARQKIINSCKQGVLIALTSVLIPLNTLMASTLFDGNSGWKSIESAHFRVHFPEKMSATAKEVVTIAEQTHKQLSHQLLWQPQEKTDVVLSDRIDISNGSTHLFPHNTIILITTPPNDAYSLEMYDNWLVTLFRHEYVHLLHLDQASGTPNKLRSIFGRLPLLYPQLFQPPWLKEGLASYLETDKQSRIGRGNSAYFQALMKVELEQGFKPLSQVNMPTTEWPIGRTPYLYGYYFWDFIHQRYGSEKSAELVSHFRNNLIPFRINSNSKQVLGKDLESLWHEFEAFLRVQFTNSKPTSAATIIAPHAEISGFAKQSKKELYYIEQSLYGPSLLVKKSNSGIRELITEVHGYRYDVHPEQGVLLIQSEYHHNGIYNEIFHIGDDGRSQQLTQKGRYRSVVWHPDGDKFYAITLNDQAHGIEQMTLSGEKIRLWQGNREVIGSVDISPNGKALAAAIWTEANRWDLALFDIEKRQWETINPAEGVEAQVQFTPSGDLLFSADYDGSYNIYRLNLQSHTLYQLSHENSAARYPALNQNGDRLFYSHLGGSGDQLVSTPYQEKELSLPAPISYAQNHTFSETTHTDSHDYQPTPYLMPSWWAPYLWLSNLRSEVGIITGSQDPIKRHRYQLYLGYESQQQLPLGWINYQYTDSQYIWSLQAERKANFISNAGELQRVTLDDEWSISYERPHLKYDYQWSWLLGVGQENSIEQMGSSNSTFSPSQNWSFQGAALSYNSSRAYLRSIGSMDGSTINVRVEHYQGDASGLAGRIDWRHYLRLGKQQSLALRLLYAKSAESAPLLSLGGSEITSSKRSTKSNNLELFNHHDIALRGYASGMLSHEVTLGSLEWCFPIASVERSWMAPPIGISQLHGRLFYDVANTQLDKSPQKIFQGIGMELYGEFILGYELPTQLGVGIAKGIDTLGETQLYLSLQMELDAI